MYDENYLCNKLPKTLRPYIAKSFCLQDKLVLSQTKSELRSFLWKTSNI